MFRLYVLLTAALLSGGTGCRPSKLPKASGAALAPAPVETSFSNGNEKPPSPPEVAVYQPQDGDLIFQSLPRNAIVDAIEGSSGSPFSHCGIIRSGAEGWRVLEAIGPVKETPLPSLDRAGPRRGLYRLPSQGRLAFLNSGLHPHG